MDGRVELVRVSTTVDGEGVSEGRRAKKRRTDGLLIINLF